MKSPPMYICLCNSYTDKDIAFAVSEGGARCADSAYKVLGSDFNCGSCRDCAQCVVDDTLEGQPLQHSTGPDILPAPVLMAAE